MSTTSRALLDRFAPVPEQVREAALRHEVAGTRPHEEVTMLAEPAEHNRHWRSVLAGGAVIGGAG
jgi:hypothetical protein